MTDKWDYLFYIVLGVGLYESGGKLSGYNEGLGLLLGLVGMFVFLFVTIKIYRFTKQTPKR